MGAKPRPIAEPEPPPEAPPLELSADAAPKKRRSRALPAPGNYDYRRDPRQLSLDLGDKNKEG
jgi:hypothetical protein